MHAPCLILMQCLLTLTGNVSNGHRLTIVYACVRVMCMRVCTVVLSDDSTHPSRVWVHNGKINIHCLNKSNKYVHAHIFMIHSRSNKVECAVLTVYWVGNIRRETPKLMLVWQYCINAMYDNIVWCGPTSFHSQNWSTVGEVSWGNVLANQRQFQEYQILMCPSHLRVPFTRLRTISTCIENYYQLNSLSL